MRVNKLFKMKHILVKTDRHPSFKYEGASKANTMLATNVPERYSISIACQEEDSKTDRKEALITILMPDNKRWAGTMQDLCTLVAGNDSYLKS